MKNAWQRKYEDHYGPIPKEEDGRFYEIHHKDGNRLNNDPSNLEALTLQQHYDIHFKQGDFGCCFKMAQRMNFTIEQKSKLSTLANQKRIEEGTHNLLGKKNPIHKRVKEGTSNLPDLWKSLRSKIKNGTSHLQQKLTCPYCKIIGKGPMMKRWHFDNCKSKE